MADIDAMLAKAGVTVKPPYDKYTKGSMRRFLDENGEHHPSHILVKVTSGVDVVEPRRPSPRTHRRRRHGGLDAGGRLPQGPIGLCASAAR